MKNADVAVAIRRAVTWLVLLTLVMLALAVLGRLALVAGWSSGWAWAIVVWPVSGLGVWWIRKAASALLG